VNSDITAMNEITESNIKITVLSDHIIINYIDGISSIDIYNSNGTLVRSLSTHPETEQEISIANFPSGVYALLINKTKSMKFIKL
jgi:hypothetical protein